MVAFTSIAMFGGMSYWAIAQYLTLPDPSKYGELLKITSVFIRFPRAVEIMALTRMIFSSFSFLVIGVILPQARPDLRLLAEKTYLCLTMLVFNTAFLELVFTYWSVRAIFKKTIQYCTTAAQSNSQTICLKISEQEMIQLKVRVSDTCLSLS